jgi:collagen type III alpha
VLVGVIAATNIGRTKVGDFAVGKCVKQSGGRASSVSCTTSGAFKIIDKVDQQDRCPDANQPFVVLQRSGTKDEILCLRPATEK